MKTFYVTNFFYSKKDYFDDVANFTETYNDKEYLTSNIFDMEHFALKRCFNFKIVINIIKIPVEAKQ